MRMIVKTICITGIWKLIVYLSDVKDIWKEALIAILVIFPSSLLSAQVYVWTAGFCNYVICIFLELLALGCLKKIEDCKKIYSKVLLVIMLIISAFLAQLCSENSTVINVITAVIILLQKIIDQKGKMQIEMIGIPVKTKYDIENGKTTLIKYIQSKNCEASKIEIIRPKILKYQEKKHTF